MIKTNKKSKEEDILNYLMDKIGLSYEAYKSIPISSIIFSYGIRKGQITPTIGQSLIASLLNPFIFIICSPVSNLSSA